MESIADVNNDEESVSFEFQSLDVDTYAKSIEGVLRDLKGGKLSFDHAVQRPVVWGKEQKSLLMHSVGIGMKLNPIWVVRVGGMTYVIDGKQRLTTAVSFVRNEFALDGVGRIKGHEVNGKTFLQLPEDLRDAIAKDFNFTFYKIDKPENMSIEIFFEMVSQLFIRLNSGKPLSKAHIRHATLNGRLAEFINICTNHHFFSQTVNMTDAQKRSGGLEELITQCLLLISRNGVAELSGDQLSDFVCNLKENGLNDGLKNAFISTMDYFREAVPERYAPLKKVHATTLFLLAFKAMNEGIDPHNFGGFVQQLFRKLACETKNGEEKLTGYVYSRDGKFLGSEEHLFVKYKRGVEQASTQIDSVECRWKALLHEYERAIATSPLFKKKPVVEQSVNGGEAPKKRGRPAGSKNK